MDAALLVAKLHGDLLRLIAERENFHFDGLRSAASHLRRKRNVDSKVCKKLAAVDEAFNLNRHITCVSARTFFQTIEHLLDGDTNDVISDVPSSLASTLPNSGDIEISTVDSVPTHAPEFFCLYDSDDVAASPSVMDASTQTAHADNGVLVLPNPADLVLAAHAQACALLRGDLVAAAVRIADSLAAGNDPDKDHICVPVLEHDADSSPAFVGDGARISVVSVIDDVLTTAVHHHCDHARDVVDALAMAADEFAYNMDLCPDLSVDYVASFTLEWPELCLRFAPPAPCAGDPASTTVR